MIGSLTNKFRLGVLGVVLALSLSACETTGMGPKQTVGTVGGAVAGGVIGSQFGGGTGQLVATGLGTLLGAWAGNSIGQSLDRADQMYIANTTNSALETGRSGQQIGWRNPDTGRSGYVVPGEARFDGPNRVCRPYEQVIVIDGRTERATGTACRNPSGTWEVVSGRGGY